MGHLRRAAAGAACDTGERGGRAGRESIPAAQEEGAAAVGPGWRGRCGRRAGCERGVCCVSPRPLKRRDHEAHPVSYWAAHSSSTRSLASSSGAASLASGCRQAVRRAGEVGGQQVGQGRARGRHRDQLFCLPAGPPAAPAHPPSQPPTHLHVRQVRVLRAACLAQHRCNEGDGLQGRQGRRRDAVQACLDWAAVAGKVRRPLLRPAPVLGPKPAVQPTQPYLPQALLPTCTVLPSPISSASTPPVPRTYCLRSRAGFGW